MGNQLIKDTHIEKDSIGNGGNGSQWEMHSGHRLDKNKTPVTIFLFEKKAVAKLPASTREEFLTLVKKEAQTLARFKHPSILSLLDPLLEDQRSMGFVTESVKGSLNTFINGNNVSEIFPTELDTKFHLLELAETINFLHSSVKSCHLSINPENIYVLADEKWKLGGFTFATQVMQGGMADTNIDFNRPADGRLTPNIKFSAPEVANITSKCTYASDIFSFGCLIYTIYKINQDKNTNNPYLINANNVNGVQDFKKDIFKQNLSCIPDPIRSTVQRMLNPEPNMRITITDFLNHSWFKDPFIQTVKHLETLYQKEVPQQQAFLKGLSQIILKFEKKFIMSKLLPLINNLIRNEQLASSILPIYFKLIDNEETPFLSKEEFQSLIWPSIKGLATGKEIPAQALYLLVQNSNLLVDIGDVKEIQTVFVPLLIKSFECNVQKLQVLALQKTEALFSKIEYTVSKSQILPRILHLCTDNNIDIRKESLTLLSKIYSVFDKTVINDQVLTTIEKVRKMNNNYAINMTILTIFEGISKNIGVEIIANKLLISMIPMLVDPNLSKPEYKAYLSTVHAYLKRIEEEQEKRFEGMPDQPSLDAFIPDFNIAPKPAKREDKPTGGEFDFLNSAFGGSSEPQQFGGSSGSGNDFDFTGFDDQFGGAKAQESAFGSSNSLGGGGYQSTPNWNQGSTSQSGVDLNFGSSTQPKAKTNPMIIKSQNQGPSNPATGGTGKNIKALGNPFTSTGQAQVSAGKTTSSDPFNFANQTQPMNKPTPPASQQNQNMFSNMKMSGSQGPNQFNQQGNFGGQNKWDMLDSEIQSYDNTSSPYGGTNQSTNQPSNMFNSNQGKSPNQFQSPTMGSGGLNMQGPSSNITGWDDLDIDLGGNPTSTSTSNTFNQSGPKPGGYNQGGFNTGGMQNQGGFNQGGMNQGGFNQGSTNQGGFNQGGMNQGGFNQGGFNQGGMNQGGFNQGGMNQGGFNQGGFNQNKPSQPKTGLQIGGQKPQFGGGAAPIKTTKDPFSGSDDFFSNFDVKDSGPKKTTPFTKSPMKNNNDLL